MQTEREVVEVSPDRIPADCEIVARVGESFAMLMADMRAALGHRKDTGHGTPAEDRILVEHRLLVPIGRAERLARQLLAYGGGQPLAPSALELLPFLCALAHALRKALDVHIDVSVDVAEDCPPCHVDPRALEEALLNLVANARDAMPDGGRLQFAAKKEITPEGSPMVALSVADTGAGMAADFLARAVKPFVTTKTGDPLAGLGLAATDGFARQSGGRLTLRSSVGDGVRATLSLPTAPSARPPPDDER